MEDGPWMPWENYSAVRGVVLFAHDDLADTEKDLAEDKNGSHTASTTGMTVAADQDATEAQSSQLTAH